MLGNQREIYSQFAKRLCYDLYDWKDIAIRLYQKAVKEELNSRHLITEIAEILSELGVERSYPSIKYHIDKQNLFKQAGVGFPKIDKRWKVKAGSNLDKALAVRNWE